MPYGGMGYGKKKKAKGRKRAGMAGFNRSPGMPGGVAGTMTKLRGMPGGVAGTMTKLRGMYGGGSRPAPRAQAARRKSQARVKGAQRKAAARGRR